MLLLYYLSFLCRSGCLYSLSLSAVMNEQVRLVVLNNREFRDSVVYRLHKGAVIRFVLGPSLMGHTLRLFTNHGLASTEFKELPFVQPSKHCNDTLDRYSDVVCTVSGPFKYFFTIDSSSIDDIAGSGYFIVDPVLTTGANNVVLPLDGIQCQTHLSKLLGKFPEWEARLRVAKESGYNMIHLTPVQQLGVSNSAYSIADPLAFNSAFQASGDSTFTFSHLAKFVAKLRSEWGILTITDVVWNHAAESSAWLKSHPECGYNLSNSPHLRPAFLLDRALKHFGNEVAANKWAHRGLPANIADEHHLDVSVPVLPSLVDFQTYDLERGKALRSILYDDVLPKLRLHEFFQVNIDSHVEQFAKGLQDCHGTPSTDVCEDIVLLQDPEYKRFGSTVDLAVALKLYCRRDRHRGDVDRLSNAVQEFRARLVDLNNTAAGVCWSHLSAAVDATIGHVRYERVSAYGPRYKDYTSHHLLCTEYFTHFDDDSDLETDESAMNDASKNVLFMAHNGWVMADDPLGNFANKDRTVYLRRELVCWGDCVKLRYGDTPEDCPFLWNLMTEYSELTAKTFHGIRVDNCHSTPIHVAEYLLGKARAVCPELYVVAELFTGKEDIDHVFVNRLGITSLVREAQSAPDAHEEGRLLYKYGGRPIGAFIQPSVKPIEAVIAHAIFMDQTHDNVAAIEKRTVFDLFPTAGLVAMACCATGSTRGYDELVPYHVNVVSEDRLYCSWSDAEQPPVGCVNSKSGIIRGKALLNELHYNLGKGGFSQIYVDQLTDDTIAVSRHNPHTHQSIILVARTAFFAKKNLAHVSPLTVPGVIDEIILEAKLVKTSDGGASGTHGEQPDANKRFISGLLGYALEYREHIKTCSSKFTEINKREDGIHVVDFTDFVPGSIIVFSVSMPGAAKEAVLKVRGNLIDFGYQVTTYSGRNFAPGLESAIELVDIIDKELSLQDLNYVLFRSNEEQAEDGGGVYVIPKHGALVYCGLQGIISILNDVRYSNDLAHPLCDNLRGGTWFPEYICNRLCARGNTKRLGEWLRKVFNHFNSIPDYLRPCYFDAVVTGVYSLLLEGVFSKMSPFVQDGGDFVKGLALGSVIFLGRSSKSPLPLLSPNLAKPSPPISEDGKPICSTLAAGLPHFAAGLFRNWGRDTFISLPGLALIPGRFNEARYIILAYGGTLRHGLIPNLLGEGICARYNCRDAVWWWLWSIKCYCDIVPNGVSILNDVVLRLYPTDDAVGGECNKEEPLHATIQEAMNRHFRGIEFRERNAGNQIDEHMSDEGFNVEVGVNKDTGFVYGGNQFNCGTWMDKMGSSERAGNRGKPATPRDGSAVELVGLSACIVRWLFGLFSNGTYPYGGVSAEESGKNGPAWTWQQWSDRIKDNFEAHFWIGENDDSKHISSKYVNKRCIYKDTCCSQIPWTDYQLRPNFTIAITVAPHLFDMTHALQAINVAEPLLLGPLGVKTLDPYDWAYTANYDNADDSADYKRGKGFGYHNGPEWLWIAGFFYRAKLTVARELRMSQPDLLKNTVADLQKRLSGHWSFIQQSPWRALPELTNADGVLCKDSCPAQAWSVGCLLEVMFDMEKLA